jgi:hypothetical protein
MDGQQPSHQPHLPDDHNPNLAAASYAAFYSSEQDPSPYSLAYNTQPYQVVQHAPVPPPRGSFNVTPRSQNACSSDNLLHVSLHAGQISQTDLAHHHQQAAGLQFHNLSLMSPSQFQPTVYNPPQQHVPVSISGSPPQSPNMYDPLSPPISGSDTSADSVYHHHHHHHPHQHQHQPHHPTHSRNSSATGSPPSSRSSLVHRNSNPIRYNPTPSPTSSSSRRRGRSVHDSDEEDIMGVDISSNLAHTRKEATRRQRIEAEQRRRDELRDGYAKLKEVLPISNQKSSKVSLLERGSSVPLPCCTGPNPLVSLSYQSHSLDGQDEPGIARAGRRPGGGSEEATKTQRENLAWRRQYTFTRSP